VDAGQLHIAYEYAYAGELLMSRGDKGDFSHDISGKVGAYVDLGVKGSVSVDSKSTISFKSAQGRRAAFAYKAGRVTQQGNGWVLYPEVVTKSGLTPTGQQYIPQRGFVPELLDLAE
jgi:hypothetical protein